MVPIICFRNFTKYKGNLKYKKIRIQLNFYADKYKMDIIIFIHDNNSV